MEWLRLTWKLVLSRPIVLMVGVVAGAMLVGHCSNWRAARMIEAESMILPQTREAVRAPRFELTPEEAARLCGGLRPILPKDEGQSVGRRRGGSVLVQGSTPLDADGASFRLGLDHQVPALLDSLEVKKLPHGGRADVELAIGAERPTVTIYPNPRPWLEGMSRWRISALVGGPLDGSASGALVVPRIEWRGLRTGRIDHGASVTHCPARAVIGGYSVGFE